MNPLLISALLTGGGALYNWKVQNDYQKGVNAENAKVMQMEQLARDAERQRQLGMEQIQAERVAKALMQANPETIAQTATEEAPESDIVRSAESYNLPVLTGQNEKSAVAGDIGKIVADALARSKGILKAQATLSAQDTGMRDTQDGLTRMASDIATVASNRRGSLAASQRETTIPAATVTPSSSPIGDLLLLAGMAYGGTNGKLGELFGKGASPMVAPGTARMVTPKAAAGSIFGGSISSGLPAIY